MLCPLAVGLWGQHAMFRSRLEGRTSPQRASHPRVIREAFRYLPRLPSELKRENRTNVHPQGNQMAHPIRAMFARDRVPNAGKMRRSDARTKPDSPSRKRAIFARNRAPNAGNATKRRPVRVPKHHQSSSQCLAKFLGIPHLNEAPGSGQLLPAATCIGSRFRKEKKGKKSKRKESQKLFAISEPYILR